MARWTATRSRRELPPLSRTKTTEGRCSAPKAGDKLAYFLALEGHREGTHSAERPVLGCRHRLSGLRADQSAHWAGRRSHNLDPTTAGSYVGRIVLAAMCDKLFDIDAQLNIVPQLALSHETSQDGKTVTIKLRPNVKFHDGEPFNAEAVKFTLDRGLTKEDSKRKAELSQIDKVEVADPMTVRLLLKAPFSPLIAQLTDRAGMMVSPKAVKEAGDKFVNKPICAGPFKFAERVVQDHITLERFADYWDKDRIHVDRITYRPIPDSTVRLANLLAGALDVIERLLPTDIPAVKSDSKLKLLL